tara:strand:- start:11894 stop:12031 length:138 start_codon:yes stop_codon:yes gene_type:complete
LVIPKEGTQLEEKCLKLKVPRVWLRTRFSKFDETPAALLSALRTL